MRKQVFITLLFSIFFLSALKAGANGPQFKFANTRLDFGTVYTDQLPDNKIKIEFTNTGDAPLILSQVRACCGTKVESWPSEPILPGEKGEINIEIRLVPRPQRISRTVIVSSNDPKNPTSIFRIMGEVVEKAQ
jgi:hypothetical protein